MTFILIALNTTKVNVINYTAKYQSCVPIDHSRSLVYNATYFVDKTKTDIDKIHGTNKQKNNSKNNMNNHLAIVKADERNVTIILNNKEINTQKQSNLYI